MRLLCGDDKKYEEMRSFYDLARKRRIRSTGKSIVKDAEMPTFLHFVVILRCVAGGYFGIQMALW